ncbi:transcriptional regulator [Herbaspirillum rubrisubalbicans]|uniref:Transcriptional regulator n=1 Tax=Herbaspirillum rubrisubalbicans TaxID=80842 RepID=A0ABX9C7D6_9BURK|nr:MULTISPECIES: LysR family transcriptional regulator [Herbaspirillum]NQE47199.1 transcriptional regulator [Herbaspirillum rubrisubalbicans]RAM66848.1 transcriptional regulator [Herbaspirillum rubrisubalbicans]RAN47507.1 transcriptional regulator [Herbaspirillum rubrisubalbicans]
MNQIDTLKIFQRVAELASFSGAARQLGLPNASVSLAVQQLEQMLGTRLLQRTTRRVQLTADGEAFYRRSKDLLDEFESLRGMFRAGGQPLSGKLRVDMSSAMAREVVLPALPAFLAQHPQLEIELSASDRRVDLVAEGFDCVLRTGALDDSSLVARTIGHLVQVNCASPAYLKRHGTPRTLEDLAHHQLVHYRQVLGGRSPGWEWFDGSQTHTLPMAGSVTVNSTETYYAACQAGLGLIQLPLVGARKRRLLGADKLVEVLPQYRPAPMPVSLLYASRRHVPARLLEFMDWLHALIFPLTQEGGLVA